MKPIIHTAFIITMLLANAACGGGKSNSSNSPVAPGNTVLVGGWTGTLTRPGGLAPVSVRWQPTLDGFSLSGPITLTNNGMSVTIRAQGNVGGNDASGYSIHTSFSSNSGDIPALPNCAIRGNTNATQADPFPQPFNTISVPSFNISYAGCRGFIETPPLSDFVQETVQLNLTKQ